MHTVPSGPAMRVDNHEVPHVLLNTDFCANTRVTSIDGGVRLVIRTGIWGWTGESGPAGKGPCGRHRSTRPADHNPGSGTSDPGTGWSVAAGL